MYYLNFCTSLLNITEWFGSPMEAPPTGRYIAERPNTTYTLLRINITCIISNFIQKSLFI